MGTRKKIQVIAQYLIETYTTDLTLYQALDLAAKIHTAELLASGISTNTNEDALRFLASVIKNKLDEINTGITHLNMNVQNLYTED